MKKPKYSYEYPRLSVTTDCVIFAYDGKNVSVLVIERGNNPYKGKWAFPGGFLNMDETVEEGAARELEEETGLKNTNCFQFHTFSALDRDPRGRTITIGFLALINKNDVVVKAGDDAVKAIWYNINSMPELAFDHMDVFQKAIVQLKSDITYPSQLQKDVRKYFNENELQNILQIVSNEYTERVF